MCLSIPGQLKMVSKNKFLVKYKTQQVEVNNSLVKNLKAGDWVLVQNKFIVQKFTNKQVEEFFQLINN